MLLVAGLLAVAAGALPLVLLQAHRSSGTSPPAAAPASTRSSVGVPPAAGRRPRRADARKPPVTTASVPPVRTAPVAVSPAPPAATAAPAPRRPPPVRRVARRKPAGRPVSAPPHVAGRGAAASRHVTPPTRATHVQRARGHGYSGHGRGAKHEAVPVRAHGRPRRPHDPVAPHFASVARATVATRLVRRPHRVHRAARRQPAAHPVPARTHVPSHAVASSRPVAPAGSATHMQRAHGHAYGGHGRGGAREAVPVWAHGRPQRAVIPRGHGGGSRPGKGKQP